MLEEYKKLYEDCANSAIPDWKKKSKSELCNIYVQSEKSYEKEGAVSAIICKCWNIFQHNYRDQPYIPIEDWYDSMVEAIMYVLNNHVWTKPDNVLYGKQNGPEMALHRCIWSRKLNVYGLNQKSKRVINLHLQSLDDLKEKAGVDPAIEIDNNGYVFTEYIKTIIQKNSIEYGIILDLIYQGTAVEKLSREIKQLSDSYFDYFSKRYAADRKEVEKIINQMQNNKQLNKFLEYYILCLQRDEDTINYLK